MELILFLGICLLIIWRTTLFFERNAEERKRCGEGSGAEGGAIGDYDGGFGDGGGGDGGGE